MTRLNIPQEIRRFLREVELPGRYLGNEKNAIRKPLSGVDFRMALCYPDTYEVGMSHLGLAILYHLANEPVGQYVERCFAPWPDMAGIMKERGIPLFSLETCTPLREFDLVGFSLQHELLYTNVLYMLDLAGIPLRSEERGEDDPIICAGGNGALTPEPMAPAFDLFLPGDGEATLPGVIALLRELKAKGLSREERLLEVATGFPHAYVPCLYEPGYAGDGGYLGLEARHPGAPATIQQGLVENLEEIPVPTAPIVPGIRCVHERITLEIMRGCTRGCRFCQAGMTRRPLRTRSPEQLTAAARAVYLHTGHDEISLCSLSSADYPALDRLVEQLNERFEPLKVGISLPSLRVDEKLQKLPGLASAVRKAGLTIAPEAATEALRKRINKDISDHDLEKAALIAYEQGWRRIKLYFMIGLPGETDQDVLAIARLARRISELRRRCQKGPADVTVSVSTFVPKAHTPFQWCAMDRPETVRRKHRLLLSTRPPRSIRFNFHDVRMSWVEAILARGDRRIFPAVEAAFRNGACFDAWKDRFSHEIWENALQQQGIDTERILHHERPKDEVFSWDHMQPGPSREFLHGEFERALDGELTGYCEEEACHLCGVDPRVCASLKKARGSGNAADGEE